jgi:TPR repeat protein
MATQLYTGLDDVVEEDEKAAFQLYKQAADKGHVAALYMTADCLLEARGTPCDKPRAIPLLYAAAESGHRHARHKMRALLAETEEES